MVVVAVSIVLVAASVGASFVAGRRAGRRLTVPWRTIFQVAEHRQQCLGQDRARIERELGSALHIEAWVWRELFERPRPLDRRRAGGAP